MQEKPFCPAVRNYLAEAFRIGAGMDICLLSIDGDNPEFAEPTCEDAVAVSRDAAVLAMQVFAQRQKQRIAKSPTAGATDPKIRITAQPTGRHISYDTFLGPDWCRSLRRVALKGVLHGAATDEEQATAQAEYRHWHRARGLWPGESAHGLTHVFFRPPYGLSTGKKRGKRQTSDGWQDVVLTYPSRDEIESLYALLVSRLFHDLSDPTVIYEWSNDWSNYFDDGKDWWGTYYWTVAMPQVNELVVLGASHTD